MISEPHPSLPRWSRWLSPLAPVYAAALRVRHRLYDLRLLPRTRPSRPVISVGNLVLGGTGKTPTIAALAAAILDLGLLPCLLTRGHGRRSTERIVVCRGQGPLVSAEVGGDEPVLLARREPRLLVVADRRRASAAMWAERHLSPDVFLLDDGFQHRALERDRDIVLIDGKDPFGGGSLPPTGLLREPTGSLRRATDILVSGSLTADLAAKLKSLAPTARIAQASRTTAGPFGEDGRLLEPEALNGRRLLLVTGVARPEGVAAAAAGLGLDIVARETHPDHHRYGPDDFERIARRLASEQLDGVLATGKDVVKFTRDVGFPWWWIDVDITADWHPILSVLDEWNVQG